MSLIEWAMTSCSSRRGLSPLAAGLVLTGYAVALLLAASRTTMRRDVT